tara:strand:- start:710 stop:916 length:207 start_codon:yes stop_codon:yes gene_type:complete
MNLEDLLLSILKDFEDVNLHSESGRELLVNEIMAKIKDPSIGWFLDAGTELGEHKRRKRLALNGDPYS